MTDPIFTYGRYLHNIFSKYSMLVVNGSKCKPMASCITAHGFSRKDYHQTVDNILQTYSILNPTKEKHFSLVSDSCKTESYTRFEDLFNDWSQ